MIQKFDVEFLTELADDNRVLAALLPVTRDERLRTLASCVILRERDAFAVFKHDLLQQWRTVVFDIDAEPPTEFTISCLCHLFDKEKARTLRLTSKSREVGIPLRAVFVGPIQRPNMQSNPEYVWSLSLEDWEAARVLLRRPKPEKVKYRERWKAA